MHQCAEGLYIFGHFHKLPVPGNDVTSIIIIGIRDYTIKGIWDIYSEEGRSSNLANEKRP